VQRLGVNDIFTILIYSLYQKNLRKSSPLGATPSSPRRPGLGFGNNHVEQSSDNKVFVVEDDVLLLLDI
jgi:hypothetical protein